MPMAANGARGQALVELALAAPLLLLLTSGVLAAGRVARAELGTAQVAAKAARAAALADSRAAAQQEGMAQGEATAREDGLSIRALKLVVDTDGFGRGGSVGATTSYTVSFADLPLLGWARLTVSARHTEPVDRYRSMASGGGP